MILLLGIFLAYSFGCTPPAAAVTQDIATVRVHMMRSADATLDVSREQWKAARQGYFLTINEVFAPVGLRWQVERVLTNPMPNMLAIQASVEGRLPGGRALGKNVDLNRHVAPNGWDLYLVNRTTQFGFGGAYICAVQGQQRRGAIFVPMTNSEGNATHPRKWAHEFGHAMGLLHTPCTAEFADNLMMSGTCRLAKIDRVSLNAHQRSRIRAQWKRGGPVACDAMKSNGVVLRD